MASPDFDLLRKRNSPDYLNWLAVGNAIRVLCDGLRQYADAEMKDFHSIMLSKVKGNKCHCSCKPGVKPNAHEYVKTSCIWAKQLGKFHCLKKKSRIPWHQSDSGKWHDPTLGYWEIAKIFMSDLGHDWSKVKDPSSTDSTGLLNLLFSCTHFKVQQSLVKSVRDMRNKWAHCPDQSLTNSEKQLAFDEIFHLLDDAELMSCNEVQDSRVVIQKVRVANVSILQEDELKIWKEYRYFKECELSREVKKKRKEMERGLKQLHEMISVVARLQEPPTESHQPKTPCYSIACLFICTLLGMLFRNGSGHVLWLKLMVLMLTVSQIGDKSILSSDNGICYRATLKSPISHFEFQEFNFSSHLNYKRGNFFGRKWLFQELENIYVNGSGPLGVLITGEPGSGKSAVMSQLICSPYSSLLIHNNIIGYHMCDYSEKGKRNGARFVRNLVDQIAGSIREYSDFIINNKQVRKELEKRCESDPIGCFHSAIIGPLRELKDQPDNLQYIFIDALDECFEKDRKSSVILEILDNKLSLFPDWLRIILSSRNWTAVTYKLPQTVKRMVLDPADERNLEDIHSYIRHFLSQNSFFTDRLLEAMGLTSTVEGKNSLINEMSRKGEGNFLFVKTTLEYLNTSEGRINFHSFPTSLYDTYDIYFKRQFGKDEFRNYTLFFEVLLAASSPLKLTEITSILKYPTNMFSELLQHVSSLLRFEQDETISIYHQSFAEWLMNKTDHTGILYINKSRGHHKIADHIFDMIEKNSTTPHLHELTELAVHVSLGGMEEKQLKRMKRINVSKIRGCCGRCILHDLAVRNKTARILDVFIKMFESADIPDSGGMTPAFYAAVEGNVENLKVFIKNGIDLNYQHADIELHVPLLTQDPIKAIMQKMLGFNGANILHIAANHGNKKIVRLLIEHGASVEKTNTAGLTPLHAAAQKGHLAVVKQLHRYGAAADSISLHHAAARNHTKIVEFLLKDVGLNDECLPCKSANIPSFGVNSTIQDIHSFFCESAFHAAVSRGHVEIVKLLMAFGKSTLECKHHSGRTPLMDAVERNDTEMVELLLREGADVDAECGSRNLYTKNICPVLSLYANDFFYTLYCELGDCLCGKRAIHFCGEYGLWKMAEKLIYERHANMLATDCENRISASFAAFNDHADFIINFNRTLSELIHHKIINEAFFRPAALCISNRMLRLLSDNANTDIFGKIDENGRTLLHYVAGRSPCAITSFSHLQCMQRRLNNRINYSNFCAKTLSNESKKRLTTIKFLTESQKNWTWFVNLQDKAGRSALHYAALGGFARAVKYFVRHGGGDWRIKDREGNTPLMLALSTEPSVSKFIYPYRMTSEIIVKSWNTTTYDETVAYLIWQQRSSTKKCDVESFKILNTLIKRRMPLSLYKLLKTGVDVNCTIGQSLRPFLLHLKFRDEQISEIFKIFKINITVECDIPFIESELHLMSFYGVSDNIGNFFKTSFNSHPLPVQRLASENPKPMKIFDECNDAEGYLPLHRAAEGGNIDAIDWFIDSGVDSSKRTRSGLTALDISIFRLGTSILYSLFISGEKDSVDLTPVASEYMVSERQIQRSFKKLLIESWKTSKHTGYSLWCNSKLERLSPLHFAASKGAGIFEFVYEKAVKVIPGLPRNCTNKHNLVPLYLSQLSHPNLPIGNITEHYPDREAEYHIIYDIFYESPSVNFNYKSNVRDAVNCSGFYDLLPKRNILDEKMKRCYTACYVWASYVYNHSVNLLPFNVFQDCRNYGVNDEWSPKIALMYNLQYYSERYNFPSIYKKDISNALKCSQECRCTDIMRLLQRLFTSSQYFTNRMVNNIFIAKRMGWKDTSLDGDVRDRWPFYFFVRKALNKYDSYRYLETLKAGRRIHHMHYYFTSGAYNDFDNDNDTDNIDESADDDIDDHNEN